MFRFLAKIPTFVYLTFFIALALALAYFTRDAVMGDAFIHFTFARGIAHGQPFFYNGVFSAGSTSPLWSLMLAPFWNLLGDNIVWFVKIFSGFFVGTSIVLTYFLARKITASVGIEGETAPSRLRGLPIFAALIFSTNFLLSWWAAKGMETPMYISLVLASFLVYFYLIDCAEYRSDKFLIFKPQFLKNVQNSNAPIFLGVNKTKATVATVAFGNSIFRSIVSEILLGILLGLTILTRPEGWFLAVFLGVFLLARKGWRVIFTVGVPALLIPAPYYFYLYAMTGQIFPSSMARVLHARQWAHETLGIFWTSEIIKIFLTKYLPLTIFFGVFKWKLWRDCRRHDDVSPSASVNNERGKTSAPSVANDFCDWFTFGPIFLWLAFHVLFFTFVMPTSQGERYLLAVIPFFIILSLLGLWQFQARKYFSALVAFVLIGSVGISVVQFRERLAYIVSCEVPYIDSVRRETGIWLRDHTPPDAVIAMKEVDQSAYYSGRQMLSMDGTLDTKAVPFVVAHDQLGFLKKYRPDYLVMEEDMYALYLDWQKSNLIPLLDHELKFGGVKRIGDTFFTLENKMKVGDPTACSNFKSEYFWYFYKINYLR